ARASVTFIPGDEFVKTFRVINDEKFDAFVRVSVEGDLASYVTIDDALPSLGEDGTDITYRVNFPREAPPPGEHILRIYVEPVLATDSSNVAAHVRLAHKLTVTVPPEGAFPTLDLDIREVRDKVELTANVRNVGTRDITSMTPTFALLEEGKQGDPVASAVLGAQSLRAGDKQSMTTRFDAAAIIPGVYEARVSLDYDGKTAELTRAWQRGSPTLQLLNAPTFVKAGDISPFDLTVKSNWNQGLRNIYAEIMVVDQADTIVRSFRTETIDIAARDEVTFTSFFDARGLGQDKLRVKVKFYLGANQAQEHVLYVDVVDAQRYAILSAASPAKGSSDVVRKGILVVLVMLVAGIVLIEVWRMRSRAPAPSSPAMAIEAFARSSAALGYGKDEVRKNLLDPQLPALASLIQEMPRE
ncbi:MAG: hypothetical protein AABY13_01040, partial [Nanoarchaeota archaeon]